VMGGGGIIFHTGKLGRRDVNARFGRGATPKAVCQRLWPRRDAEIVVTPYAVKRTEILKKQL
jgi:hypothetical protein